MWPDPTPPLTPDSDPKHKQAAEALAALRAAPKNGDRIIWYGRRLAYIGRYQGAIDVYTKGLTFHRNSPKLLRHRGHRYITLRRFADAITDLERAAQEADGRPDQIEPDGIPNARNTTTSTLHTNIFYHLGLARYCRGEFAVALDAWERCLGAAKNPDMEVATRYWLFLCATRLGHRTKAQSILEPVRPHWDVIENHAYHKLLLLFRGDLSRADLTKETGAAADPIQNKTLAYGLARHHFLTGDTKTGEAALREVAAGSSPAFGCIAAEADLARSKR